MAGSINEFERGSAASLFLIANKIHIHQTSTLVSLRVSLRSWLWVSPRFYFCFCLNADALKSTTGGKLNR